MLEENGKHGVKLSSKEYVVFINFLLILNYRVQAQRQEIRKTSGVVELIQQLTPETREGTRVF